MIPPEVTAAALPLIAGWVWWVDKKVSAHEDIIKRVDQLTQLLLEDRLNAQSQARRNAT